MFQVTQSRPRMLGCKAPEPLSFSVCGQLISPSGFLHHRRCFTETVLILVTEGSLYLNANGSSFALTAGAYILLPAGEEHFGFRSSEGSLSYLWAHFRTKQGFEPVHADDAKGYSYLLPETAFASPSGRTAQLFHQLMDLSQEYFRTCSISQSLPGPVVSAREWIKNHYFLPFDLPELAAAIGYSADYLSSLFKRSMGISIVRYTNRLRIKTAKTLLSNYGVSIKEAAFSCGFSDEKYFMKMFKEQEGISPTQYKHSFSRRNIN